MRLIWILWFGGKNFTSSDNEKVQMVNVMRSKTGQQRPKKT